MTFSTRRSPPSSGGATPNSRWSRISAPNVTILFMRAKAPIISVVMAGSASIAQIWLIPWQNEEVNMENYFSVLNAINVNDKTEKKNGLTYLSWAWAWGEVKKLHPDATYTIYENKDGLFYHTDGKTCWVKTGVTVNGIEHIEYLPVMDFKNRSIPADSVTSFDVNKAIQRSLTKAVARHGLGLYIYAGEDLPEGDATPVRKEPPKELPPLNCEDCKGVIMPFIQDGKMVKSAEEIADYTIGKYGVPLCAECAAKRKAAK